MKTGDKFKILKPIELSEGRFENAGEVGECKITWISGDLIEYKSEHGKFFTTKSNLKSKSIEL